MTKLERYKTTLGVLNEMNPVNVMGVIKIINEKILEENKKIEEEIKLAHTIDVEDFETFKRYVSDILEEELRERTPHGEYGGDIEGIFYWKGNSYKCYLDPFWNRYDKQYYYIDDINTFTVELIEDGE